MTNTDFTITELKIEGVKLITPFFRQDDRGYFMKSFEKEVFKSFGLENEVAEMLESYSVKNVIRGMHFQTTNPQIKLVRVVKGEIQDIVCDLRKGSKTFMKHESVVLSEENRLALWVPKGFAHGFEVKSESALVSYCCVGRYEKGSDSGINAFDADLALPWQTTQPIMSPRDKALGSLQDFIKNYGGLS